MLKIDGFKLRIIHMMVKDYHCQLAQGRQMLKYKIAICGMSHGHFQLIVYHVPGIIGFVSANIMKRRHKHKVSQFKLLITALAFQHLIQIIRHPGTMIHRPAAHQLKRITHQQKNVFTVNVFHTNPHAFPQPADSGLQAQYFFPLTGHISSG